MDPTDARAAAAKLPPIDGLNMWPMLSSGAASPRTEVAIGAADIVNVGKGTVVQALLRADGYKLIIGALDQNMWQSPSYPNASTNWPETPYHCGVPTTPPTGKGGCLFNVCVRAGLLPSVSDCRNNTSPLLPPPRGRLTDPTEHDDIAAGNPAIVKELYTRILEIQKTVYSPDRGADNGLACKAAVQKWGGFWGPFVA